MYKLGWKLETWLVWLANSNNHLSHKSECWLIQKCSQSVSADDNTNDIFTGESIRNAESQSPGAWWEWALRRLLCGHAEGVGGYPEVQVPHTSSWGRCVRSVGCQWHLDRHGGRAHQQGEWSHKGIGFNQGLKLDRTALQCHAFSPFLGCLMIIGIVKCCYIS